MKPEHRYLFITVGTFLSWVAAAAIGGLSCMLLVMGSEFFLLGLFGDRL